MKTALFKKFGQPAECIELAEQPTPQPEARQLRLRIHYSPIHPSDLNLIEGVYGTLPELPACPGGEASATIDAVGTDLQNDFTVGSTVILITRPKDGTWSEYILVSPDEVHLLPSGIDLEQASMLAINPATAWCLLENFTKLSPGDWVIINAANSAVGYCLIQLARERGLKTLAFVRREEALLPLQLLGADCVLLDSPDSTAQAREAFGDTAPRLALNGVGGDSALRMMDLLATEGTHVTYGAMSRRSLKVPNKFLIFKRLTLTGFWVTRWLESASSEEISSMLGHLAELMQNNKLRMPIAETFPLSEVKLAITAALGDRRAGKILLKIQSP